MARFGDAVYNDVRQKLKALDKTKKDQLLSISQLQVQDASLNQNGTIDAILDNIGFFTDNEKLKELVHDPQYIAEAMAFKVGGQIATDVSKYMSADRSIKLEISNGEINDLDQIERGKLIQFVWLKDNSIKILPTKDAGGKINPKGYHSVMANYQPVRCAGTLEMNRAGKITHSHACCRKYFGRRRHQRSCRT